MTDFYDWPGYPNAPPPTPTRSDIAGPRRVSSQIFNFEESLLKHARELDVIAKSSTVDNGSDDSDEDVERELITSAQHKCIIMASQLLKMAINPHTQMPSLYHNKTTFTSKITGNLGETSMYEPPSVKNILFFILVSIFMVYIGTSMTNNFNPISLLYEVAVSIIILKIVSTFFDISFN